MWSLATSSNLDSDAVVQIVALVVGLVQTIALAVLADRSRRVRRTDRSTDRRPSLDRPVERRNAP